MTDFQKLLLALLGLLGVSVFVARRSLDALLPTLKPGVSADNLKPVMNDALIAVSAVAGQVGAPNVITSTSDGTHMPGSKHFTDEAIDARRVDWPKFDNLALATEQANLIRRKLPDDFDVVLEPTHVHIEFDPKVA